MVKDSSAIRGKLTREKATQVVERASLAIERKALNDVRAVDCSGCNSGVFVKARIEGKEMNVLLDTGAGVNVVDLSTMESLRRRDSVEKFCGELRSVDGKPVTTTGLARLNLDLGSMKGQEDFVVVPHCKPSVILGLNFVKKAQNDSRLCERRTVHTFSVPGTAENEGSCIAMGRREKESLPAEQK